MSRQARPPPFRLDGRGDGSVEAFRQSLTFPDEARRSEIVPLQGAKPKDFSVRATALDAIA